MNSSHLQHIFDKANFIRELGCELITMENGVCEIHLTVLDKHLQQNDFVHAGVLATFADHTAGCAAYTVAEPNMTVLTTEFKINFLRPAIGQKIIARSKVLKPGKMISVCQSEIFCGTSWRRKDGSGGPGEHCKYPIVLYLTHHNVPAISDIVAS